MYFICFFFQKFSKSFYSDKEQAGANARAIRKRNRKTAVARYKVDYYINIKQNRNRTEASKIEKAALFHIIK